MVFTQDESLSVVMRLTQAAEQQSASCQAARISSFAVKKRFHLNSILALLREEGPSTLFTNHNLQSIIVAIDV